MHGGEHERAACLLTRRRAPTATVFGAFGARKKLGPIGTPYVVPVTGSDLGLEGATPSHTGPAAPPEGSMGGRRGSQTAVARGSERVKWSGAAEHSGLTAATADLTKRA